MITLYHRDDCPFCWKVRIVLAELSLNYQNIPVARGDKPPNVVALSPQRTVPVLVEADVVLWESGIIAEYLIERYGSGLLPPTPAERAHVRSIQRFSDHVIGQALRDIIFEKRSKPRGEWNSQLLREADVRWRRCLDWLESRLKPGLAFSDHFSLAECALLPRFGLAEQYGVGVDRRHPRLQKWYAAHCTRSSFITTRPAPPLEA